MKTWVSGLCKVLQMHQGRGAVLYSPRRDVRHRVTRIGGAFEYLAGQSRLPRPGIRPASFASTPDLDQDALPAGRRNCGGPPRGNRCCSNDCPGDCCSGRADGRSCDCCSRSRPATPALQPAPYIGLSHAPSRLPTSVVSRAACSYWQIEKHSKSSARRSHTRSCARWRSAW